MSETLLFLLSFQGMLLGAFFYGGLLWTVQKGLGATRPALWFAASYLLRTVIATAGLYGLAGESWRRLLVTLLGFLAARLLVTRLCRAGRPGELYREGGHAA